MTIKNACELDPETGEAIIIATGLKMPQKSITLCIDETGMYYRIPIACINDPIEYSVDKELDLLKAKEKPPENNIQLKVRQAGGKEYPFNVTNWMMIKELKNLYGKKLEQIPLSMRFFCLGKELKDDMNLYSYDLHDEIIIQALIKWQE